MIRARALSAGVPLPPPGSFRDAVMQETLYRERNLRYSEVVVFAVLLERIGHMLLDLRGPAETEEAYRARHAPLHQTMDEMLKFYEAELFEDRYLPSYRQAEAEAERKKRQEALEAARRDRQTAARVASFTEKKKS